MISNQSPKRQLPLIVLLTSLVILLLLCTGGALFAQRVSNSTDTSVNRSRLTSSSTWRQVYIKPFSLIDLGTGTIQVGAEDKWNDRLSLSVDYGIRFTPLSYQSKTTDRKNYRYSKTNVELKYFLHPTRSRNSDGLHYFSLRGFYFPQRYQLNNGFVNLDSGSYLYQYSDLKRIVWTLTLISGHQFNKNRWMYNPYFGVGIRSIHLQQHPYNLTPGMPGGLVDWDFSSHIERSRGTFYRPNFAAGVTIGYLLGK